MVVCCIIVSIHYNCLEKLLSSDNLIPNSTLYTQRNHKYSNIESNKSSNNPPLSFLLFQSLPNQAGGKHSFCLQEKKSEPLFLIPKLYYLCKSFYCDQRHKMLQRLYVAPSLKQLGYRKRMEKAYQEVLFFTPELQNLSVFIF